MKTNGEVERLMTEKPADYVRFQRANFVVTDMAQEWIDSRKSNKPWALLVGHKAPHSFYYPERKYVHAFDYVNIPYPATAFQLDDNAPWYKQRLDTWHGIYGPLFDYRKKWPDRSPAGVKDFAAMNRAFGVAEVEVVTVEEIASLYPLVETRGLLGGTWIAEDGMASPVDIVNAFVK